MRLLKWIGDDRGPGTYSDLRVEGLGTVVFTTPVCRVADDVAETLLQTGKFAEVTEGRIYVPRADGTWARHFVTTDDEEE